MHTTTDGEYLWAIILAENKWPAGAHLITRVEQGEFGEVRWSECGQRFTAGTHPRGWWSTGPGELPLCEQYVHCGRSLMDGLAAAGKFKADMERLRSDPGVSTEELPALRAAILALATGPGDGPHPGR